MKTISIDIDDHKFQQLEKISQKMRVQKDSLLQEMFEELIEDLYDSVVLENRLNDPNQTFYTLEEVKEKLGI